MNIMKGKQITCYKRTHSQKSKYNILGLVNKIGKNSYQQRNASIKAYWYQDLKNSEEKRNSPTSYFFKFGKFKHLKWTCVPKSSCCETGTNQTLFLRSILNGHSFLLHRWLTQRPRTAGTPMQALISHNLVLQPSRLGPQAYLPDTHYTHRTLFFRQQLKTFRGFLQTK